MSEMIAGFLHGMTFYPFPCLVWEPFDRWSDRKLGAYVAGVFTTAAVPVVLLLVSL